jgi:hypothetical protein
MGIAGFRPENTGDQHDDRHAEYNEAIRKMCMTVVSLRMCQNHSFREISVFWLKGAHTHSQTGNNLGFPDACVRV